MRIIATLALALTVTAGADELNETLSWMDNSFNAHERNGAFGHGHTGWYTRDKTKGPHGEMLAYGSTQNFASDGCRMTLHQQDDPAADLAQVVVASVMPVALQSSHTTPDPSRTPVGAFSPPRPRVAPLPRQRTGGVPEWRDGGIRWAGVGRTS